MFKVGDKVVSKSQDTISEIFEITAIHDDYIGSFEYELNYGFLRKATPEEIAAGHRIDHIVDVNDMGDDSHIENHVSPLCKVAEAHVDEALKLKRLG